MELIDPVVPEAAAEATEEEPALKGALAAEELTVAGAVAIPAEVKVTLITIEMPRLPEVWICPQLETQDLDLTQLTGFNTCWMDLRRLGDVVEASEKLKALDLPMVGEKVKIRVNLPQAKSSMRSSEALARKKTQQL
jgi:hypothetical protein